MGTSPLWPALLAGLLALALYAATLAPGLTWAHDGADGGDLLAAALTRGVPHPPGYPTDQLLLRAAIALFPGEPARAGNWLSALCAAAAVALLADLARRMLPDRPGRGPVALAAGLAWAASPTLWSQAVITEVYTLNALAVVLLLWLLWRWRETAAAGRAGQRWLALAGFVFGLGLGNHLSLTLMLPGMAVWLWSNLTPQPPVMKIAGGWVLLAAMLGLCIYAYLPLAAAGNPPVNWGDPDTLPRLWWVVSGRAYRGLVFGVEWRWLPGRLAAWVADALRQLGGGPWGALLALVGLWQVDRHDHAWWRLTGLTALAYSAYAIGYNTPDSYVYLIPVWAVAALWLAAGADCGLRITDCRLRMAPSAIGHRPSAIRIFALLLLFALPAISVGRFWGQMDLRHDRAAQEFVENALAEAEPDAVILTATGGPTFALWYTLYGLGRRPDLIPINVNLYVYPWYQRTLAARHPFLVEATGDPDLPLLDQLVADVAARRPLYRAEELNVVLPGYDEQPEGVLVRMVTR